MNFERTPNRLFVVNFYLNSKQFLSENSLVVLCTASILFLPILRNMSLSRGLLQSRVAWSCNSNRDLLKICRDSPTQAYHLRVRVVSLTPHSMRVVHCPPTLIPSSKSDQTGIVTEKHLREHEEDSEPPFGVLQIKLAGVETPLHKRALEELKRPQT